MHDANPVESPLYPRARYARELVPALSSRVFEPARSRLARIPLHVAVIAIGTVAIAKGWLPWIVTPLLSLAIGVSFACLTFVAHETLHGAIVHSRWRQLAVGWIGFLPFVVSPRLWVAWHNRVHHSRANHEDDPDAYATLARYRARRSTRFSVDAFSLGGRRWRGILSLVLGFTVQSVDQFLSTRERGYLSRRELRLAVVEMALGVGVWATVAVLVGFVPFVFAYVLPLLVANACVMAFILTNHNLSPRVTVNDPLISSLTVTTSRVVEWLTLGFGFHVEHHLFPHMSTRHAREVRAAVKARWPERYQSMSLRAALRALHRTARVYKDATTLLDPTTGQEHRTLLPAHSFAGIQKSRG